MTGPGEGEDDHYPYNIEHTCRCGKKLIGPWWGVWLCEECGLKQKADLAARPYKPLWKERES